VLLGPIRLIFWGGIAPLVVISGLRMAGLDAGWLGIVQLVPIVLLLISFVLLIDIALSAVVPGAYDNASGVATVLSLAAALDEQPPEHLDVWVVLPGAEECNAQGMARYVQAHRKELDRERTFVVNVDSVSYGTVHYLASEGAIVSYPMDRRLLELCEAAAIGDERLGARPVRIPTHTDALPARARGFRAISILSLENGLTPPYYHTPEDTPAKLDEQAMTKAVEFTLALVRALDREVGRVEAVAPEPAGQV
jgi:Zn-dependent M28 family amino/carboxypeptidase